MKPYKIIKSAGKSIKKAKIICPLKKNKIPLFFLKNCFTPNKNEIILPNQ